MSKPKFNLLDKSLLPNVIDYYCKEFRGLKVKPEWTSVCCPFHEDRNPSLSIHLVSGGFHCFSCGAHGGDLIDFHKKRYQMTFIQTVNFFNAWKQ